MAIANFYVDGFNLYHALDELNQPHLKWLDLKLLCKRLLDNRGSRSKIGRIVYCTAISKDPNKAARHGQYIRALEFTGVEVLKGHFSSEPARCYAECGKFFVRRTEKRSDVHLALSIYRDALLNDVDELFLLTTDGDQAATAEFIQAHAPDKTLITVAPPGRELNHAIRAHCDGKQTITVEMLEGCIFPVVVIDSEKGVIAKAPAPYHPPPGWVHPDQRPRKQRARFEEVSSK